jgi:hypothetical protein
MKEKVKVYVLYDVDGNIGDNTIMHGTINDIRIWAKNLWKQDQDWIRDLMIDLGGILNEEDFYTKLDEDLVLFAFLEGAGYGLFPLCEVPLDDFYDDKKPTQELIDEVLFQIKVDIAEGDLTALDEMLKAMPIQQLVSYLPEK